MKAKDSRVLGLRKVSGFKGLRACEQGLYRAERS